MSQTAYAGCSRAFWTRGAINRWRCASSLEATLSTTLTKVWPASSRRRKPFGIIDKCDEDGLVPQPFVSQDAGGMCNCCGDCCGILRSIKMHPKPAEKVLTQLLRGR